MKKTCKFLLLTLTLGCIVNAYAENKVANFREFIGGLNDNDINTCYKTVADACADEKAKGDWMAYKNCIVPIMQQETTCVQPGALINAADAIYTAVDKINHYPHVDIVYATTIMADKASSIFAIGKNGDFINIDRFPINLKKANGYGALAKKYPHMEAFDIVQDSAAHEHLPNGGDRLSFKREIHDGCRACPTIAFTKEAYDFDATGKFVGAKVLRLTPVTGNKK